jgi:hypothetical protein
VTRGAIEALRRLPPHAVGGFLAARLWGLPNPALSCAGELRWGRRGSRVLWLAGRRAGRWRDFESGEGGDLIDAVRAATGCRFTDALRLAADATSVPVSGCPRPAPARNDLRRRHRACARILARCRPVRGTPAELYLAGRDLILGPGDGDDLRFHPGLRHPQGSTWPALVALVRDPAGRLVGLHRLWLTHEGDKAPVAPVRLSLRRAVHMAGGSVRFGPAGAEVEAVAEGIETALSLRMALPGLTARAVLGAGALARWSPGPSVRRVLLCPDHDAAGLRAARACRELLAGADIELRLTVPPRLGEDVNDLLRRAGRAAVRDLVRAALAG